MKKKVGILTFHRSINYGAYLQAYALCSVVQNFLGKEVKAEIIDYESEKAYNVYYNTYHKTNLNLYKKFRKAVNKLKTSARYLKTDDLEKAFDYFRKQKYDMIIVGSDEVWKINGMRGFPNVYWLNGDINNTTIVSYGVSSRNEIKTISKVQEEYIKEALSVYEYIGVRDYLTQKMVKSIGNREAYINCDPVFLYDFGQKKEYRNELYKRFNLKEQKKIFLVMIPDSRLVQLIKRRFGEEYHIISVYDTIKYADINMTDIDPFEWINVISCADFFVTNRFHGTCFAMKYNIPFLSLDDYDSIGTSKIFDLLSRCGLETFYYTYKGHQTDEKRNTILDTIEGMKNKKVDFNNSINNLKQDSETFFDFLKGVDL